MIAPASSAPGAVSKRPAGPGGSFRGRHWIAFVVAGLGAALLLSTLIFAPWNPRLAGVVLVIGIVLVALSYVLASAAQTMDSVDTGRGHSDP
jgi:hypothetical protein